LALIILLFIEFEITLNTTWKELFSTYMVKKWKNLIELVKREEWFGLTLIGLVQNAALIFRNIKESVLDVEHLLGTFKARFYLLNNY